MYIDPATRYNISLLIIHCILITFAYRWWKLIKNDAMYLSSLTFFTFRHIVLIHFHAKCVQLLFLNYQLSKQNVNSQLRSFYSNKILHPTCPNRIFLLMYFFFFNVSFIEYFSFLSRLRKETHLQILLLLFLLMLKSDK